MSRHRDKGYAAAAIVLAALASASLETARADKPATTGAAPLTAQPAKDGSTKDGATDAALRRAPPAIAARADRGYCREQAAKRRLFGLGRHKFLQRCRRARRSRPAPAPPAR